MQVRPLAPSIPARTQTAYAGPVGPQDTFAPQGEVAIPHPKPNFAPSATIETIARDLQHQWAERMQGQQKCTIAVVCERGWRPTEQHDDVLNICDAIMDAGGLPKLIYLDNGNVKDQLKDVQGLALPGGRDIDPARYGATLGPHMDPQEPDAKFDDFEIEAIRYAFASGLPMLGHCRGFQIMNVAAGGTMKQHVPADFKSPEGWGSKYGNRVDHRPEETRHDFAKRVDPVQFLFVEDFARLHGLVGSLDSVNSIHHQCLDQIGSLLVPIAFALDGLVEGVERRGMPWQQGYQFHPEALRYTDSRYQGLYDNLVNDGVKFARGELKAQ